MTAGLMTPFLTRAANFWHSRHKLEQSGRAEGDLQPQQRDSKATLRVSFEVIVAFEVFGTDPASPSRVDLNFWPN